MDKENSPAKHVSEKLMKFFSKRPQFMSFTLQTGYALYVLDNKTDDEPDKEERYYMTEQDGKNTSSKCLAIRGMAKATTKKSTIFKASRSKNFKCGDLNQNEAKTQSILGGLASISTKFWCKSTI